MTQGPGPDSAQRRITPAGAGGRSVFGLTKGEFARFRGGGRRAALAFLVIVPTLLAAVYLWANWDPLGSLDELPVALVNEDEPTQAGGQSVSGGSAIVDRLTAAPLLGWQQVDAGAAKDGLGDGTYFGVLTIPRDFSARLGSPAGDDPKRARLTFQLDDANGYLAGVALSTVDQELQSQVDAAAQSAYAEATFAGYDLVTKGFDFAADDAEQLAKSAGDAHEAAKALSASLDELEAGARDVKIGTGDVSKGTADLSAGLKDASDTVAKAADQLQAAIDRGEDPDAGAGADDDEAAADENADENATTPATTPAGDSPIAAAIAALTTAAGKAGDNVAQVQQDASDAGKAASDLRDEARDANRAGAEVADDAGAVSKRAEAFRDSLERGSSGLPAGTDGSREQLADVLVHPVAIQVTTANPAGSYGRGLAPLFLAFALGTFSLLVFLLLRPVADREAAHGVSAGTLALGAWLPATLLGVGGAVVLLLVGLLLGLDPDSPGAALLLLVLGVATFVAIVQALRLVFGPAGLAVGLVLLVVQVAASGGVYPAELLPGVLQALSPLLPLTWLVDGFRVAISGGPDSDVLAALLLFAVVLLVALAVSAAAIARRRDDVTPSPSPILQP